MRKKRKILIIGSIVLAGCIVSHAVYARVIPGWDEPWDPPNYYSTTSISRADTNNPSFFYRDLGWQGGSVLDTERLAKWTTIVSQCTSWLENAQKILNIKILNTLHLNTDKLNINDNARKRIENITEETYRLSQGNGILGSDTFRKTNRNDEDESKYDKDKQAQAVENATLSIAETSRHAMSDIDNINRQLDELMEQANQAQGETEIRQIHGQINALWEAVWARRNALLVNMANMKSITDTVKNNDLIEGARLSEAAKLNIQDPYNRSQRQEELLPKPEAKGFVKFKE